MNEEPVLFQAFREPPEIRLARARAFPLLPQEQQRAVALAFLRHHSGTESDTETEHVTQADLSGASDLRDEELVYLSALGELEEIHLDHQAITAAGLQHLAGLENLRVLTLAETGVASLHTLSGHTGLQVLKLNWQDELNDNGLQGLENLSHLRELHLAGTAITDVTLRRLAGLTRLRVLDLSLLFDRISDEGLVALRGLSELEELRLGDNANLTNRGLANLAALTRLVDLDLRNTGISDGGLAQLHGLKELDLVLAAGSQVTIAGAEELVAILPQVAVAIAGRLVRKRRDLVDYQRRSVDESCSVEVGEDWDIHSWRSSPYVWIDLRESGYQKLEHDSLHYGASTVEIVREEVAAGTTAQQVLRERFGEQEAQARPLEEDIRPAAGVNVCSRRFTDEGRTYLAFAWVRGELAYTLVGWVSATRPDAWAPVVRLAHSLRFTAGDLSLEPESSLMVLEDRPVLNAAPSWADPSAEEQALVRAVRDCPDDDTPRLRYAAWLEQRGDPRGLLIRVQCGLQAGPAGDEEEDALREQQRLLLEQHGPQWLAPVERLGLGAPRFQRGFLEQGEIATAALVDHAERLFQFAPLLHQLALRWAWVDVERLARCPSLARVRSLDLSNHAQGSRLGAERLAKLLDSPYLGGLQALNLSYNPVGQDGIKVLAGSPSLAGLTVLTLTFCGLSNAGVADLAASAHLVGLRTLSLSGNITALGIRALAEAGPLCRLTGLNLWGCQLGDEGAQVLASSSKLAGLTSLALGSTGLGDEGAKALAYSAWLGRLETLVLSHNPIGDAGLTALAASGNLARLTTLRLREVRASATALRTLLSSPHLDNLRTLDLDAHTLGAGAVHALLDGSVVERLTDLSLSLHGLGDEAVELLAASPRLGSLRKLHLGGFTLGEVGAEALLSSPYLGRLRWLRVAGGSGMSPNLREKMRQRFRAGFEMA
jgi:uncharacterized protein (TIGR02996 family)